MKRFLALATSCALMIAALLAAAAPALVPAAAPPSGDKVIKIGVFEPASGDSASGGKKEMLGMQYANSETPTVTVGGEEYKVELVYCDNGSSTGQGPHRASQLVSEGVAMVLGSYGSGVSIACRPHLRQRWHPRHRRDLHQPQRHRRQRLLLPHLLPGSLPGHCSGQLLHG